MFFCIVTNSIAQGNFLLELEEIKSDFSKNKMKINLDRLNKIQAKYSNEFKQCDKKVKMLRAYAICYYKHWEDQMELEINRDTILPLILNCDAVERFILAQVYFNIGNQHSWFNRVDSTKFYYQKCIDTEKTLLKPGPYSGRHYLGIGDYFRKLGDLDKSLVYQLRAAKLIEESGSEDLHLNRKYLANIYRDKEDFPLQEKYLKEAKVLLEKKYPNKDHRDYSNIIEELASANYSLNDNSESIKNYEEALLILRTKVPDYNNKLTDINRTKKRLSYAHVKEKDFDKAFDIQTRLLKSYLNPSNGFDQQEISGIKEDIGDTYFASGEYVKSLSEYQSAMNSLVRSFNNDILINPPIKNNQISNKEFLRRQLGLKSKALFKAGLEISDKNYLLSTIDAIQKYDTLVRLKLNQDFEEGSHQTLFDQSKEYYKYGIFAGWELYQEESSLENADYVYNFISKLKSQLLFRNIQQDKKQEQELSEDQMAQKDTLEKQVSAKQLAIQTAEFNGDDAGYKKAINEYFDLKLEQESFLKEVGLLDALDMSDFIETPSIEKIQQELAAKTALIEYYLVDDKIFRVLITKNSFEISTDELNAEKLLAVYGEASTGKAVSDLSPQILGTINTTSIAGIENLIIIPDEELLQFPFEILKLNGSQLVENYNISYEYSSAFLFDENNSSASKDFVGFASDYNDAGFKTLNENYTYGVDGINLSPLDNAAEEIEISKAALGGAIFLNGAATKKSFTSEAPQSSILHLALHGVLHERVPDLSALVFESENEDFLLTASEIYNLDIPTDLTVLSSCNSGVGPIRTGDGVRSLTRSFIHAGSESVITSLWEASDASTAQILGSFYQFLKKGKSKSESLRLAKLEYLDSVAPTYQHPRYWAHLVLVGNTAPIFNGSTSRLVFWGTVAVAILFIFVFLLRKNARNTSKN